MTDDKQPALIPGLDAAPQLAAGLAEMHRLHGISSNMICGDCVYCVPNTTAPRTRRWYKCVKSRVTAGAATDWRLSWPACGLGRRNGQ